MDPYSRWMNDVFDERDLISVPTLWQTFFAFGRTGFSENSVMEIDIIRGNEKTAKVGVRGEVSRSLGSNQAALNVGKFTAFARRSPLVTEFTDIHASQLEFRTAGENPYGPASQLGRMRSLLQDGNMEAVRRILRLDEKLAAQVMTTGVQDAGGGQTYDFKRNTNLTITVGTNWSNAAAPALADISGACFKGRQIGRVMFDMAIFGTTALRGFLANTEVIAKADNRRFELVQVGPTNPVPDKFMKFVDGGAVPYGLLQVDGFSLWMFTTVDSYDNDAGTAVKYLADDLVVLTKSDARRDRFFGPPERLPMTPARQAELQFWTGFGGDGIALPPMTRAAAGVVNTAAFWYDVYQDQNNKSLTCEVQHSPIFSPTAVDTTAVLDTAP
jgi:hypothetical protein